ncbi:MAG: sigma-70 family RNA polymerase sigma factor [Capsulimonadaceae bacterium]|nr:sigma-70 family RNA polymerase sigma factor [Capsulimonadaceae bacterium]
MENDDAALQESVRAEQEGEGGARPRYNLLPDAAVCRLAQAGDQRALSTLLMRHERWIRRCAAAWRIPGHEHEDVYAVAVIGAMSAIRQFDPSRNARLTTYIWYGVRRECEHMCRFARRQKRDWSEENVSLNALPQEDAQALGDLAERSIEETVLGEIEGRRLLRVVLDSQTGRSAARNCAVLERLYDGEGLLEAGRQMGISKQLVNRIREQARRPLAREIKMARDAAK